MDERKSNQPSQTRTEQQTSHSTEGQAGNQQEVSNETNQTDGGENFYSNRERGNYEPGRSAENESGGGTLY